MPGLSCSVSCFHFFFWPFPSKFVIYTNCVPAVVPDLFSQKVKLKVTVGETDLPVVVGDITGFHQSDTK